MKTCQWCHRELELIAFARSVQAKDGRQPVCKACHAANWRRNHNIASAPPRPRVSPYDRIATVLDTIERAVAFGYREEIQDAINDARKELRLV
jgi:hypothetical protein